MSHENTRAMIIGSIMKRNGIPFKAKNVIEATGLSKQNVAYHLNKLVEMAVLEKTGTNYSVVDAERIIDVLVKTSDKAPATRAYDTIALSEISPTQLNQIMVTIARARAMKLPDSAETKAAVIDDINQSIRSLQQAKKWLTSYMPEMMTARRAIKKDFEGFIKGYSNVLALYDIEITCSQLELEADLTEKLED